jgi:putative transposase
LNEMREIWAKHPFYGYRRITWALKQQGLLANHKRVQRLMKQGGIHAIYPGPNTSRRNKQHAVHPYLLRGLEITRPNQAWMVDITYLRLDKGFIYLVALIDVYSRYVIGWRLSTTLETGFCVEALSDALALGKPDIINSDQGCQFTSTEWTSYLVENEIQISMTGKGRCLDNVYIERFWRSLKREKFYLFEYSSIKELKKDIAEYMDFYNNHRPHQSLNNRILSSLYLKESPVATIRF